MIESSQNPLLQQEPFGRVEERFATLRLDIGDYRLTKLAKTIVAFRIQLR